MAMAPSVPEGHPPLLRSFGQLLCYWLKSLCPTPSPDQWPQRFFGTVFHREQSRCEGSSAANHYLVLLPQPHTLRL